MGTWSTLTPLLLIPSLLLRLCLWTPPDTTRSSLAVRRLKAELENDDLKGMISAFASGTQADLEKEVMELRTANAMLEAQVEALSAELSGK